MESQTEPETRFQKSKLSPRERVLIQEIARTNSIHIAAANLNIQRSTADVMLSNIRKKFQECVETVEEIYLYRRKRGILGKILIPYKGHRRPRM